MVGMQKQKRYIESKYKIDLEEMEAMTKSKWKKQIKHKIQEHIEKEARKREKYMKKLRHQTEDQFNRKEYLRKLGIKKSNTVMRRRLEMIDIGNNYGRGRKCKCGEKETLEHIVVCKAVRKEMKPEIRKEWLYETEDTEKMEATSQWIETYLEKREREEKDQQIKKSRKKTKAHMGRSNQNQYNQYYQYFSDNTD